LRISIHLNATQWKNAFEYQPMVSTGCGSFPFTCAGLLTLLALVDLSAQLLSPRDEVCACCALACLLCYFRLSKSTPKSIFWVSGWELQSRRTHTYLLLYSFCAGRPRWEIFSLYVGTNNLSRWVNSTIHLLEHGTLHRASISLLCSPMACSWKISTLLAFLGLTLFLYQFRERPGWKYRKMLWKNEELCQKSNFGDVLFASLRYLSFFVGSNPSPPPTHSALFFMDDKATLELIKK
jgi:hypothetical protein